MPATKERKARKSIAEKVADERLPLPESKTRAERVNAAKKQTLQEPEGGDKFKFRAIERAIIGLACGEYIKQAKAVTKGLKRLDVTTMEMETSHSRVGLVLEMIEKVTSDSEEIEIQHHLRIAMGAALSVYGRELNKLVKGHDRLLVDNTDTQKNADVVKAIAKKIGEQLDLTEPSNDDDE